MSIPSLLLSKKLLKQPKFREFFIALFAFALLVGVIIVPIEAGHTQAKITNYFDGIYWAITTVTSVGYGDVVPVSNAGKLLAIILSVIGAMMYGIIVAMVGSYITKAQEEYYWSRLFERLNRLDEEIQTIKKHNDFLIKQTEPPHV